MQPFCIPIIASSLWINDVLSIRLLSMFSSAMSLTMTAQLKSSSECLVSRICFKSVVLPAPRNPQSRVTGTLSGNWAVGYKKCLILGLNLRF